MRIKKAEKYKNECSEITNKIIEILNLDSDQSFILYDFDRDIEKQEKIKELSSDIKKYFAASYWNGINEKTTTRPYLTVVRNLLKIQGYLFINKNIIYNTDNCKVKTTRYYIIKK
jgi:hypothetical protein